VSLDPTTAYLLDLGPHPGDDELQAFVDIEPPEALCAATLDAVFADEPEVEAPQPANNSRWFRFVVAGLGAVAAVLLVVHASPETGDVSSMTARGLDESTPSVALKMAARHQGKIERFRADQGYEPGDVLYFRYQAGGDAWLHLVHADAEGVHVLDQRQVHAGEADLSLDGEPLAWTVEHGDSNSVFALVTSNQALDSETLEQALQVSGNTQDPQSICTAAAKAGLQCDGVRVTLRSPDRVEENR
jgi:hypothetical protein